LKVNLHKLKKGGTIIANSDGFDGKNLRLAGYPDEKDPLTDGSLDNYALHTVDVTKLTRNALEGTTLGMKEKDRSKNMFVLGFIHWMYGRKIEGPARSSSGGEVRQAKPELLEANRKVLRAGYNYGDTSETFTTRFEVKPAPMPKGTYRSITGNQGTAIGLIAGAQKAGLDLFYGSYPITPASDILHELAQQEFRGEDLPGRGRDRRDLLGHRCQLRRRAGCHGQQRSGHRVEGRGHGPGLHAGDPLVVVNVQRGGPSTGLPTKTEQADLWQAMHGRNGEAPIPVIAASSPTDCFEMAFEAVQIAVEHMTPVILLTDGYMANGAEPWRFPEAKDLRPIVPISQAAVTDKPKAGR
jgi:2-oxoglutarate ferredoxin oxidoreductase subunit alpha